MQLITLSESGWLGKDNERGTYKRGHTDQDATNKYNTELARITEVPDSP